MIIKFFIIFSFLVFIIAVLHATFSIVFKYEFKCVNELLKDSKFKLETLMEQIHVCPPNIMFENWIVSDIATVSSSCNEFKSVVNQDLFDGKNGTSILQKNMDCKYKKTVHGPKFFKKTIIQNSKDNSESFKFFFEIFENLKNQHCS